MFKTLPHNFVMLLSSQVIFVKQARQLVRLKFVLNFDTCWLLASTVQKLMCFACFLERIMLEVSNATAILEVCRGKSQEALK